MRVICFFDGNCRLGDCGSGAAIVYDEDGNELGRQAMYHTGPHITNNTCEYSGLREAMLLARELGATHVRILGDSELIIRHFNKKYRCRKEHLQPWLACVWSLAEHFRECVVEELPRAGKQNKRRHMNAEADALATECMRAGHDLPWRGGIADVRA
jgi:ribonuclease HI